MCNLYSITTNQAAIIALFRVINRYVGNLPPMPGVFPDFPAPVIRNTDAGTEMVTMRWGMPPPPRMGGAPVTNIRNTSSPHWRGWLKPENRCLVPANSFAEYAPEPNPETKKKDVVWFALNEDRPLFAFAGIWTTFNGDRGTKSKPIPGPHHAYENCRGAVQGYVSSWKDGDLFDNRLNETANPVGLYKIHGCIDHLEDSVPLILGQEQYASYMANRGRFGSFVM